MRRHLATVDVLVMCDNVRTAARPFRLQGQSGVRHEPVLGVVYVSFGPVFHDHRCARYAAARTWLFAWGLRCDL